MAITGLAGIAASATQSVGGAVAPTGSTSGTTASSGPTFDQMLGQVANDAMGSLQAGEAAAIQGVTGALPPFKVVEAVMGAQRTLQQALAIRDKAVSAYQEITRMTI